MDLRRLNYRPHQVRVLVIDDDPMTSTLVSECLGTEGYVIDLATNAEAGWELAIATVPDVMISSASLPDISGLALCQRVKANQEYAELRSIYFILLLPYFSPEQNAFGLDAGADELLTKPIDPSVLKIRLRTGLRLCLLSKALTFANQKLMARNQLLSSLDLPDPITGALNHQAERSMGYLLEQIGKNPNLEILDEQNYLSVLAINVDRLQEVNARYSHDVGNEVLAAIAGRLQNACNANSLLYRYSEDMFVCITPELTPRENQNLANHLVGVIHNHQIALSNGLQLPVTITIGGTVYKAKADSEVEIRDLLDRAEHALKRAKQSGQNCVRMFEMPA